MNVSDTAVHKAIKTGRVTVAGKNENNGRPLLSWPEVKNDWEANTNAMYRTHAGGSGKDKQRASLKLPTPPATAIKSMHQHDLPKHDMQNHISDDSEPTELTDSVSLAEARRQREVYQAKLAKLEYEQKSGKMVDAGEVEAAWSKMVTAAKTRILGIPAACKSRAAGLPLEVVAIVDAVCREALENLATESIA